ncbi:MAG: ATP-dependent sacrificial sulfur transferase LarE [Rectinemataceae bacterium]
MTLDDKRSRLGTIIRSYGRVAVAFSGGVDSSLLCAVAREELGENAVAITVVSPFLPGSELNDARELASSVGIRHILVESGGIEEDVAVNSKDRCYHCKKHEFGAIARAARENGIDVVLDGSNVDDESDYRPGMRAIAELGVASPLREAGLDKEEIRELSRRLGLATSEKPAFACLASRIPYGERVDAVKLARVEKAEDYLRSLGIRQFRVRSHGDLARIEVDPSERRKLFSEAAMDAMAAAFEALGFLYSCLDLAGYRQGSLNKAIGEGGK